MVLCRSQQEKEKVQEGTSIKKVKNINFNILGLKKPKRLKDEDQLLFKWGLIY